MSRGLVQQHFINHPAADLENCGDVELMGEKLFRSFSGAGRMIKRSLLAKQNKMLLMYPQ